MKLAPPASSCRRRPLAKFIAALSSLAALASSTAPSFAGAPACSAAAAGGWCVHRRFPGEVLRGELGFRFGEPLDVDGDGVADVAAGARFKLQKKVLQNGEASIWSGANGALLRSWDGEFPDGLFGHWVLPMPDISGDGLADVLVAAPHGGSNGNMRGFLAALSPQTGQRLWQREEKKSDNLGWDLTLAGDHDGDGHRDLLVGAPAGDSGRVYLLSGHDGKLLHTYEPGAEAGSFGWYVAEIDDLDGDGRADLVAGAPFARDAGGAMVGGAWILSSATGTELKHWKSTEPRGGFGNIVTPVADLDGDGKRDVAVAAPATEDPARTLPGEVILYSSASGKELRRWSGRQAGEQFGRMVIAAGDLDGDGSEDVAVAAPWYRSESGDKAGRVELRSGRSGAVLTELVGAQEESWFGWHIRRAPDPAGRGRPALLIGSLREAVGGKPRVGAIDWYVLQREADAQGTTTRGARRSDIK